MIVVHSISQLEQPHSLYLAEDVTEEEGECGIFSPTSKFLTAHNYSFQA